MKNVKHDFFLFTKPGSHWFLIFYICTPKGKNLSRTISIIGAGKVGSFLAQSFIRAGFRITEVYSRSQEPAQSLAKKTGSRVVADVDELDRSTDLIIISVPDDQIGNVVALLPAFKGVVAHTSGTLPMSIFSGKVNKYGVFYPLQTIGNELPPDPGKIPVCLEASGKQALELLNDTASGITTNIYHLDSEQRRIAHIAAVFACNFTNQLYKVSADILQGYGLPFDLLRPLIKETARKALEHPPGEIQTGPAARGDIETVKAHLELLNDEPELKDLYLRLSKMIIRKYTGKDVEL